MSDKLRDQINELIRDEIQDVINDYVDAQDEVNRRWTNRKEWNRMSLLNTARSGFFSSDRSIRDYCQTIWNHDTNR